MPRVFAPYRGALMALSAFLVCSLPALASGQGCDDYSNFLHQVGGFATPETRAVDVQGSRAYIATGVGQLRVLDVADPAHPALLGSVAIPDAPQGIVVAGPYAYVVDHWSGITIVNITNPAAPTLVNTPHQSGQQSDIAIAGGYAYQVNTDGHRLVVTDVSSPATPVIAATFDTHQMEPLGVAVTEDRAYLVGGSLWVLDVANPEAPVLLDSLDLPGAGAGWDVDVEGNVAFVVGSGPTLTMVDVSDPSNASVIASLPLPGSYAASHVRVRDGLAYVPGPGSRLTVVDVSNPAAPRVVGLWGTEYPAYAVAFSGNTAFLATEGGLVAIDITVPSSVPIAHVVSTPDSAARIAIVGHYALVADGASGVQVIDLTNPETASVVGAYDTPGTALDIAVSGSYAYVADGAAGLTILDVGTPAAPLLVGSIDTPATGNGAGNGVAVEGNTVLLADGLAGVRVIDVSNHASPTIVATMAFGDRVNRVAIRGEHAYVFHSRLLGSALEILDVSDPAQPDWVNGTLDFGAGGAMQFIGDTAYLALAGNGILFTDEGEFRVYSLSDPTAPVLVRSDRMPSAGTGVAVAGDRAYASSLLDGLQLLDLMLPDAEPTSIGFVPFGSSVSGVGLYGSYVVAAAGELGVVVIPADCATATGVPGGRSADPATPWLAVSPNPSRSDATFRFRLAAASIVRLDLYDASGRLVRELVNGSLGAGDHVVGWDGRDDARIALPSGVYFSRLDLPTGRASTRVTLVR